LTHYVRFGRSRIHYDIIKSPFRKKIEIVVVGKKSINVLAPEIKGDNEIRKIVKSNSRWIFKKQLSLEENKKKKSTYVNGSKLLYLGREYLLHVARTKINANIENKEAFTFQKGKFVVRAMDIEPTNIKMLYEKWLQNRALSILQKKIRDYCKIIDLDPSTLKIRIKFQKNRAGSLGRNLKLNFNKNILRFPARIIDYVVVHELCHIRIPSHSRNYWRLVGAIMSDYKKRKRWIERNSQILIEP